MKRFVTYLYECKRGNKSKNVGFIRVNVRGEETTLEIYLRNVGLSETEGKIYVLIYKEALEGVELGEIKIKKGQCDCVIQVSTGDICNSGFSLDKIEGVGICLDSSLYIASCWKDTYVDEIIRGEFIKERKSMKTEVEETLQDELMAAEELPVYVEEKKGVVYEKIDLSQIRDLPSSNWHLTTNSFLVHGFWNYGYLVLKKEMEENQEKLSLGVPGIFEKPEAVMAVLFGFPEFEVVSQEMVAQKEKNQVAEDGTFGCWFVNLKM